MAKSIEEWKLEAERLECLVGGLLTALQEAREEKARLDAAFADLMVAFAAGG